MGQTVEHQRSEARWWLLLPATFGATGLVQAGLALQYDAEWARALTFGLVSAAFGCLSAGGRTQLSRPALQHDGRQL